MFRKILFSTLIVTLALFALAACVPSSPAQGTITATLPVRSADPTKPAVVISTEVANKPTIVVADDPHPQVIDDPNPGSDSAPCSEPVPAEVKDGVVSYKNIHFKVNPALGLNFMVKECKAGPVMTGWGEHVYPARIAFTADPTLLRNVIAPEIVVYEVSGDLQQYTYPLNSVVELQKMLSERPEPSPWYAGAALHTGEKYLETPFGTGVRGLVEYYQDIFFWTNNYLQYNFNGMTEDGHYFVSASLPLKAPFLMDITGSDPTTNVNTHAIPIPGWPSDFQQKGAIINNYNQEALRRFEASTPAEFAPDYELYDELIESLQIRD